MTDVTQCSLNLPGDRPWIRSKNIKMNSVITRGKLAARQYRNLTGKTLGISDEVDEFHATKLFNFRLTDACYPGYDAIRADNDEFRSRPYAFFQVQNPVSGLAQ